MRVLVLEFDDLPGLVGKEIELCAAFTTANPASARTITIGGSEGEVLSFGPCDAARPPGVFVQCAIFTKLKREAEIIIDNTSPGPGCQNGPMDDITFQFRCLDGAGSTGG